MASTSRRVGSENSLFHLTPSQSRSRRLEGWTRGSSQRHQNSDRQQDVYFESFPLRRELLMGLYTAGFEKLTPIQLASFPIALDGKDILARAKNGTGKTASFVVPILNKIDTSLSHIQAVILVPTRELAMQTSEFCQKIGSYIKNLKVVILTGGTSLKDDILRLQEKVNIVIATPGRLLDLASRNVADLRRCKLVALDEGDRLITDTFRPVVESILALCPKDKQTLIYSATFPVVVKDFTVCGLLSSSDHAESGWQDQYVPNAEIVDVTSELTLQGVSQFYCFLEDLLTRGIDIKAVNCVICFDLPNNAESYLHRIGRGGRGGFRSISISLITESDRQSLFKIENELDVEISPVPAVIDPILYVASPADDDEPTPHRPSSSKPAASVPPPSAPTPPVEPTEASQRINDPAPRQQNGRNGGGGGGANGGGPRGPGRGRGFRGRGGPPQVQA
ncbi:hypothetical protein P7C73_g4301, partial [Tremellales sp. Uapishka_1]